MAKKKRKKKLAVKADGTVTRTCRKKISLPTDRTGTPIDIGDVLQWDDGDRMRVATLTYYGEEFERIGGAWTAEGETDGEFSDNLSCSLIVWRGK